MSISESRCMAVAGVRAVATVKCAPEAMAVFNIRADASDTIECELSRVPSRSETYSVRDVSSEWPKVISGMLILQGSISRR